MSRHFRLTGRVNKHSRQFSQQYITSPPSPNLSNGDFEVVENFKLNKVAVPMNTTYSFPRKIKLSNLTYPKLCHQALPAATEF
ncbi:hypothetical protein PCANC_09926 [Puccinia coronata f. sp. avenae]|uniref:Uncharacterized protein n=1 Tax=Puccinia coronata f. sp. avenae TaxID=200324 RepID=A0A2N5V2W7_9BASI|nr:hypothetical protein PCANC_17457 [Puccinia coronata f. sp. avenae]PLW41840.1 hypothetical protein PCASD_05549 [Puccinia coronata f. sp. avenae]PLW44330.1 hypothetical protein PCANC_09926 [Puccinia coronata f. sp. avenae]